MSVTVSGLSGLTNAYTSVLSATGSLAISGASRCEDMRLPHRLETGSNRLGNGSRLAQTGWGAPGHRAAPGQPIARAIRAARSLSRSRDWLVPANTSMSPDRASRTCTTIGPVSACWSCAWSAAGGLPVAARAGAAAPMAVTASLAAPAVAAPCSRERRDNLARFASSLGMTILSVTGLRDPPGRASGVGVRRPGETGERPGHGRVSARPARMPRPQPVPGSPFTPVLRGRRPFGWVAGQEIFGNFPAWPDIGPVTLVLAA